MPVHGEFMALAFLKPDLLMAIEGGGLLKCWECDSRDNWNLTSIHELEEFAQTWCLNGDGSLAVGAAGEDLSCWKTGDGDLVWTAAGPDWVTALAMDAGSGRLATGHDDGRVLLWDLQTGELLSEIGRGEGGISAVSFGPGGGIVAAADESCRIGVWGVAGDGTIAGKLMGHKGRIVSLAWDPESGNLLSAGWDTTVRVWNVPELRPLMLINDHDGPVAAMAVASGGRSIATVDSWGNFRLWCARTWRRTKGPCPLPGEVRHAAFAPDGSLALGLDRSQALVWRDGAGLGTEMPDPGNPAAVRPALAVVGEGNQLLALAPDGKPALWPLDSWSDGPAIMVVDGKPGRFSAVAFHGEHMLALESTGCGSTIPGLFLLGNGGMSASRQATLEGESQPSCCLAIHAGSRLMALASPLNSDLWIRRLPGGDPHILVADPLGGGSPQHLAFSPDGGKLAMAGIDAVGRGGRVVVLDPVTGREIVRAQVGGWRVAWHPDGRLMALLDREGRVTVVGENGEIAGRARGGDHVRSLAYNADGAWLVACGEDKSFRVWPPTGGVPLGAMDLPGQPVLIHPLPDPTRLAVLFADGGAWIIDLPTLLEGRQD